MKKIYIFWFFALVAFNAFSQQKLLVSQYMLNQYLLNPAVGGTNDFLEAAAGYRLQWVGLEGAPRTFYITAHMPVGKAPGHYNWRSKKKFYHGIGVYATHDKTGLLSKTSFLGSYAYNFPLSSRVRWSNGIFLGFQQHRIEGSKVDMAEFDPSLPAMDINTIVPDISFGSWLYSDDFYVGLSINQLLRPDLNYSVNTSANELGALNHHYFLSGGFRFPFYHNEMEWIPSVLIRYVQGAPVSFDLNNKFRYKKMYWAGISYRHFDAIAFLAGLTLAKTVHVGYSFDLSISRLSAYHHNSHEIVIGFSMPRQFDVWSPQMFW